MLLISFEQGLCRVDTFLGFSQTRIHERITSDLPAFNEQLSSAKLIQERLRTLTDNVDELEGHLSDSEVCGLPYP